RLLSSTIVSWHNHIAQPSPSSTIYAFCSSAIGAIGFGMSFSNGGGADTKHPFRTPQAHLPDIRKQMRLSLVINA
ncbi:MAG: hypothetical protein MSH18_00815, partial [Bacteroidales bacterium]|nr:hypothetical protein [Bacteroidales bacterium]